MAKKLYQTLFLILIFSQTYAQTFNEYFDKLENAINDSSYLEALQIINKQTQLNAQWGGNYYNRILYRHRTGDIDGMFMDIKKAEFLDLQIPKYYFKLYDFYKNPNPNANPDKRKLFKQKNLSVSNDYKPVFYKKDSLRGNLTYNRGCYDVNYYHLDIAINPFKKTIQGSVLIKAKTTSMCTQIQIDAHRKLKIDSIIFQNKSLTFYRKEDALFINLNEQQPSNTNLILKIYFKGKPAKAILPPWEGGFVWKKNKSSEVWASVACEQLGASFWWPCKDHPSDEPDSMDVSINVPNPYKAISNGNLIGESYKGNTTTYKWHISYPINSYNVTFYIGNFEYFTENYTNETGNHKLEFYVMPHNLDIAKKHFLQSKEILEFYEKVFGEYPFWKDGFALVESPYAGMEHQTAIAIGGDYGRDSEQRYKNAQYDYLIVHEAAHEWWGNSVTAADMCDAWLQEGFATYAELLFIEYKYGYDEYLSEVIGKFENVLNFWPIVGPENVNDNSFIGGDIYEKGALFLHNLRCQINNDTIFFSIIKEFAVDNKLKMVRTVDFKNLVELKTGRKYSAFFHAFLNTTKIPTLEYTFEKNGASTTLNYRWKNVEDGFEMPFCVKLSDNNFKRIDANTNFQKMVFENTTVLNFVTTFSNSKNCIKNAATYHYTRLRE